MATKVHCAGIDHTLFKNSFFPNPWFYKAEALQWLQDNYEPTDNEIYVVTYPKTGTTLTLQICHQIMECYYNNTKSKDAEYYNQNQRHYTIDEWIEILRGLGL